MTDFTDNYGNVNKWKCFNEIKNIRASRSNTCNRMPLYDSPLPINKGKYDDLQSLKAIIERDYHPFSDNLHIQMPKKN